VRYDIEWPKAAGNRKTRLEHVRSVSGRSPDGLQEREDADSPISDARLKAMRNRRTNKRNPATASLCGWGNSTARWVDEAALSALRLYRVKSRSPDTSAAAAQDGRG